MATRRPKAKPTGSSHSKQWLAANERATREVETLRKDNLVTVLTRFYVSAENYNNTVSSQARELARLRGELHDTYTKLSQFDEIDRTVNLLARIRSKRHARARAAGALLPSGNVDRRNDDPSPSTQPRALQATLADLEASAGTLDNLSELEKEVALEVEDLVEERRKLLGLLGMDEHDWRHVVWRL
jgi:small-conductance mechanosensitive channel